MYVQVPHRWRARVMQDVWFSVERGGACVRRGAGPRAGRRRREAPADVQMFAAHLWTKGGACAGLSVQHWRGDGGRGCQSSTARAARAAVCAGGREAVREGAAAQGNPCSAAPPQAPPVGQKIMNVAYVRE